MMRIREYAQSDYFFALIKKDCNFILLFFPPFICPTLLSQLLLFISLNTLKLQYLNSCSIHPYQILYFLTHLPKLFPPTPIIRQHCLHFQWHPKILFPVLTETLLQILLPPLHIHFVQFIVFPLTNRMHIIIYIYEFTKLKKSIFLIFINYKI